jgi:hypothetical protein
MKSKKRLGLFEATVFLLLTGVGSHVWGQAREPVLSLAKKEKSALLETLKALVSIESGSRDDEGLAKLAGVIAGRLKELGGRVELVEPSDVYKMEDTPEKIGKMVRASFTGTGTKKILLIAHMDTVYPRGTLTQQPFRLEGDRAYAWESPMTSKASQSSFTRWQFSRRWIFGNSVRSPCSSTPTRS